MKYKVIWEGRDFDLEGIMQAGSQVSSDERRQAVIERDGHGFLQVAVPLYEDTSTDEAAGLIEEGAIESVGGDLNIHGLHAEEPQTELSFDKFLIEESEQQSLRETMRPDPEWDASQRFNARYLDHARNRVRYGGKHRVSDRRYR